MTSRHAEQLGYIVVREELTSPVVASQVLHVLEEIADRRELDIRLIWFARIDRLWLDDSFKEVKASLALNRVRLSVIPIIAGRVPISWFLVPFVIGQVVIGLAWIRWRHGVRLFHSRSYAAGTATAILSILSGIRFVFDPRSLMVEEQVSAGLWRRGGATSRFWVVAERWIVQRATAVVVTSDAMGRELASRARGTFVMIPNNYPRGPLPSRERNVCDDDSVAKVTHLCYVGSLGHWNKPAVYLDCLRAMQRAGLAARLHFFVPQASRDSLERALESARDLVPYCTVESVDQGSILARIAPLDVGLQLMDKEDTRLGIKVVEYLAAGLPVLVAPQVQGATEIVEHHRVGFVVPSEERLWAGLVANIGDVKVRRGYWATHCQAVARKNFLVEAVASRLLNLYRDVAQ